MKKRSEDCLDCRRQPIEDPHQFPFDVADRFVDEGQEVRLPYLHGLLRHLNRDRREVGVPVILLVNESVDRGLENQELCLRHFRPLRLPFNAAHVLDLPDHPRQVLHQLVYRRSRPHQRDLHLVVFHVAVTDQPDLVLLVALFEPEVLVVVHLPQQLKSQHVARVDVAFKRGLVCKHESLLDHLTVLHFKVVLLVGEHFDHWDLKGGSLQRLVRERDVDVAIPGVPLEDQLVSLVHLEQRQLLDQLVQDVGVLVPVGHVVHHYVVPLVDEPVGRRLLVLGPPDPVALECVLLVEEQDKQVNQLVLLYQQELQPRPLREHQVPVRFLHFGLYKKKTTHVTHLVGHPVIVMTGLNTRTNPS